MPQITKLVHTEEELNMEELSPNTMHFILFLESKRPKKPLAVPKCIIFFSQFFFVLLVYCCITNYPKHSSSQSRSSLAEQCGSGFLRGHSQAGAQGCSHLKAWLWPAHLIPSPFMWLLVAPCWLFTSDLSSSPYWPLHKQLGSPHDMAPAFPQSTWPKRPEPMIEAKVFYNLILEKTYH